MRAFLLSTAAILVLFLVLYLGLNLVEANMLELMALEREGAAFTIQRQGEGVLEITFGGDVVTVNAAGALSALKRWFGNLTINHDFE